MRTDYESTQTVEILGPDESYNESEFVIGLRCTADSYPGYFDPRFGGEPSSGPEFEPTTIHVPVRRVNRREGQSEFVNPLELSWEQFVAVVGEEVADKMFDRACDDAAENGGF